MGMCSLDGVQVTDKQIAEQMRTEQMTDKSAKKLLLLGTGNTGKSTFFRQFKNRYADSITAPERDIYRDSIRDQVVFYMRRVTELCMDKHNTEEEIDSFTLPEAVYNTIESYWSWDIYDQPRLNEEIGKQIEFLWNDEQIQRVYYHDIARNELAVPASCEYFWNKISAVTDEDYWPDDQDCISAYNRTSGITKLDYAYQGEPFELTDIGGQRSERRKWIHVFDGVDCLLYVVSLSAYDEILFEDRKTNAMTEQLEVFEEIINLECFKTTTVIVFLNKSDLLQSKIDRGRPISLYFDDYKGDGGFKSSTSFIRKKFKALNKSEDREMFFHITCATDPENAKLVLGDVTQRIVGKQLQNQGYL